jgi:hypothetical protein
LLSLKTSVPRETLELPELGYAVVVQGMTGKEQTNLYKQARDKSGKLDEDLFAARLIVQCVTDKEGNRILEDGETDLVLRWPGSAVTKIAQAAMRVNGLSDRGNSNATDGEDSFSD